MRVVSDQPVVYVDLEARFDSNLGIQRVTRETINRWKGDRPVVLAALTKDGTALRALTPEEDERVRSEPTSDTDTTRSSGSGDEHLIVPWRTSLFVPEIPDSLGSVTVGALARYSDNRTVALGYDTVAASSGQHVTGHERLIFNHYLTMLKYFDVIVTVSRASFEEFSGFCEALSAQGLAGPVVRQVSLPIDRSDAGAKTVAPGDELPVKILSVGSNVPRKNHLAIVYAAELLWREGLEFELTIVGGEGDMHYTAVTDAVSALVAQGRSVVLRRNVTEAELADAYASAYFTVFLSLHDSGLPVAESLASGTPVLASNYGGPLGIAAAGGCRLVDPRDDDSIVDSMRALLTEPDIVERLRREIMERDDPGWDDYADTIAATLRTEEKGR
jgi:glycosyltransferase involved in cell wall biosynthesis